MALRYFLVEIQIPEFTYVRTTATAMLQNYRYYYTCRASPDFKLKHFEKKKKKKEVAVIFSSILQEKLRHLKNNVTFLQQKERFREKCVAVQ